MRCMVDLARGAVYAGRPAFSRTVLESPIVDVAVTAGMFAVFLVIGGVLRPQRAQSLADRTPARPLNNDPVCRRNGGQDQHAGEQNVLRKPEGRNANE